MLATDPDVTEELLAERRAMGGDRYDEVWNGVHVMSPLADNEHQEIATSLGAVYKVALGWNSGHKIYTGVNISDREVDWGHNYRVPDNAVFLLGNSAKDCGTHWCGGPDFLNEILSKGDRGREKLPFYEQLAVREALLIDRYPWSLELYRLTNTRSELVGRVLPGDEQSLDSAVLPLRFRLIPGPQRPIIQVLHSDGKQSWNV